MIMKKRKLSKLMKINMLSNENDDYDTVGGFIFYHAGMIPDKGYRFDYEGYSFKVLEVENKRIYKIIIEKQSSEEDEK